MVYIHGRKAVEDVTKSLLKLATADNEGRNNNDDSLDEMPVDISNLTSMSILFDDHRITTSDVDQLVEAVMTANMRQLYVKTIVAWGPMERAFTFLKRCIADERNAVLNFKFIRPERSSFNAQRLKELTEAIQESNGKIKRLYVDCQNTTFHNVTADFESFFHAVLDAGIESVHIGGYGGTCSMELNMPPPDNAFWKKLSSNLTLKYLNISRTKMSSQCFTSLANAIVTNKGLKKLRLPQSIFYPQQRRFNEDEYREPREALTKALRTNKTLTHVWLPEIRCNSGVVNPHYILERLRESDTLLQLLAYKEDPDPACLKEMKVNRLTVEYLNGNRDIPLALYAQLFERLSHRPVLIYRFMQKGKIVQQGCGFDNFIAAELTKLQLKREEEQKELERKERKRLAELRRIEEKNRADQQQAQRAAELAARTERQLEALEQFRRLYPQDLNMDNDQRRDMLATSDRILQRCELLERRADRRRAIFRARMRAMTDTDTDRAMREMRETMEAIRFAHPLRRPHDQGETNANELNEVNDQDDSDGGSVMSDVAGDLFEILDG